MSKTLKTYPDGSQFTVKHLAAASIVGIAAMTVGSVIGVKYEDWKSARAAKKA